MKRFLLVHYGEIGLKGSNAQYFLDKLQKQMEEKLRARFGKGFKIIHTLRRFLISLPESFEESQFVDVLNYIAGIQNFKFVYEGAMDFAQLGTQILAHLPVQRGETFRVKVKRSMEMERTSVASEKEIGAVLLRGGIEMKPKMSGADLIVDVEFFNNIGYFSFKTYKGMGGLSSGSGSKLVTLISAGIDSPVAAYRMMKRGARVVFVHFHSYPYTGKEEMEQVESLVKILSGFQFDTKLYLIPFGDLQKKIATTVEIPEAIRTVLYRRMMLRIAQRVSFREEARGLVTGDSYGQVASQTADNLFAIHDVSNIPLYQPLIAYDKEEIIKISKEIGTFEVSKLPCKDSCTLFAPEKPEVKASLKKIAEYESYLQVDELVDDAFKRRDVLTSVSD